MKTLSFEQMEQINAGWPEWFTNAWNAVSDFFSDVWQWITGDALPWIQDHADISITINTDGSGKVSFSFEC